jgi:hypothetical protein
MKIIKWDYYCFKALNDIYDNEEISLMLSYYGDRGWELASVIDCPEAQSKLFLFKKPCGFLE